MKIRTAALLVAAFLTAGCGVDVLLCGMETPPVAGLDYSLAFHNVLPRVAEKYRLPLAAAR